MSHYRRTSRAACHSTVRRATHAATRLRWRAPDDLGTALTCFGRAIRSHRRLARRAPRFFDSTLVEREHREQEAHQNWINSCNAALLKVYGSAPEPPQPVSNVPPLPGAHTQLAVELELASCRAWLRLGGDALQRFRLRHPHVSVTFTRLARLLELATALGRLAVGPDPAQLQTEPATHSNALADLQRIYGEHLESPQRRENTA